jgi:pilus assembly protein CpaB
MRRGRVFILLALILLVGAAGVFILLRGLGGGGEPAPEEITPTPIGEAEIVIAAQHISRGSIIPAEAVIVSPYPADYLVETMMVDPGLVIGRRARMDIARGVPITQNMLTERAGDLLGTGSDAALAIPPGMTAISMPMNRLSGVAYALRDGDQVDVLISLLILDVDEFFQTDLPSESLFLFDTDGNLRSAFTCRQVTLEEGRLVCGTGETPPPIGHMVTDETTGLELFAGPIGDPRPRLVTQRLISNATVLHVGEFALPGEGAAPVAAAATPGPEAGAQPAEGEAVPAAILPPDVVTLIVTPQEALALNWAIKAGLDMVLTLRSPNDPTAIDETSSVTLQYLVENFDIGVPAKLPYVTEPRIEADPIQFPFTEATPAPAE